MRTFCLICLGMVFVCVQAQIEKYTRVLEPSVLVCQYECVQKVDTLGTDANKEQMILRIGKKVSQFYSEPRFHNDSLRHTPNGVKIWGQMMLQAIRTRNYASMPIPRIMTDYFYKNYPKGKLTVLTSLGTTPCFIEEDYVQQDWHLKDSVQIIQGYSCQLAECHFRGRNYRAWFTPEIPLNEGPWKFNGLPGLILEVYDTLDHYHFTLIGMVQDEVEPVCYYDFEAKREKIDRIELLRKEASKTHAGVNPEIRKARRLDTPHSSGRNAQGQTIAYDYLEKDYR